ncbi:hypothetical protein DL771_003118 [Monosporascus sp. 5C6A]|nr:hypothetical protein DL771_003118 [Monosporascus sp. 5C6A]
MAVRFLCAVLAAFHMIEARSAPDSVLNSRQAAGFRLAPEGKFAGMGLTTTCEQVLYQQIQCHAAVGGLSAKVYHDTLGDQAFTDTVCSTSCSTALTTARRRVTGACASTPELIPGYPVVALIDSVRTGWNETCLRDTETGNYCNAIIDSFDDVEDISELPREQLCSYCYGAKLRMMQSSPYSAYDELYAEELEFVNSNCEVANSPTDPLPDPININTTQPLNCGAERRYVIQAGDTCDSIALARGVSAATLYYLNPRLANCSAPATGLEVCLPLPCEATYTIQQGESCVAIGVNWGVSWRDIVAWNSGLNSRCSNLWSTNPFWGRVICVSAPGGELEGSPTPGNGTVGQPGPGDNGGQGGSGDGYSDQIVDPPAGGTVAPGTTSRCGQYIQATEGSGCNVILARSAVTMNLFLQVNPSLVSSAECSSNLVIGTWYCLHPYRYWNTTTGTSTSGSLAAAQASTEGASGTETSLASSPVPTSPIRRRAETLASRQDGPVDPGTPEDCTLWDTAYISDHDCEYFETSWGLTHEQFVSWLGHSYCVEVNYGLPPTPSSTTTTTSTGTPGPSPTQTGIVSNCNRWHHAVSGDTCAGIVSTYDSFSLTQFYNWNPAVGANCESLWLGYWYCIDLTLSLDTRCIWIRNYHYHYNSVVLDHSSPYDDHGLHERSYAHTTRGRLRL